MDDRALAELFAPHGAVNSAKVSTHVSTGQSTGVGFVEMVHDDEGESAIAALHGRANGDGTLSVCWSNSSVDSNTAGPQLFKSMNIAEEPAVPRETTERRGLP
jgi:RNA recognition motif-containing protein